MELEIRHTFDVDYTAQEEDEDLGTNPHGGQTMTVFYTPSTSTQLEQEGPAVYTLSN